MTEQASFLGGHLEDFVEIITLLRPVVHDSRTAGVCQTNIACIVLDAKFFDGSAHSRKFIVVEVAAHNNAAMNQTRIEELKYCEHWLI